jgi:hypothetical protein
MHYTDTDWYALHVELMNTNPFCVTDDQLFVLFSALKAEFLKEPPSVQQGTQELQRYPAWFCRDQPVMTRVVLSVQEHVKREYTWEQFVRIMLSVLESS